MNEEAFARAYARSVVGPCPQPLVFRELETSTGVPDLLLVRSRSSELLIPTRLRSLTNGRAVVASMLSDSRPRTVGYLSGHTGLDRQVVRRALGELSTAGIAKSTPTGSWLLAKGLDLRGYRIEVVEFKLRNWRKALAQACRYRSLADRVTVVMPSLGDRSAAPAKSAFTAYGIGLATFSVQNEQLRYLVRPRRSGPLSPASRLDAIGRAASTFLASMSPTP
jgi:hypothetical protein